MFEADVGDLDQAVLTMTAASARALASVARIDASRAWEADGATSATAWLAARYALLWATAVEWVRVARALRGLPRIAAAHAEGRLSWDQLRPLTKFATEETDERWAGEAGSYSCAWLWREAKRHERLLEREESEIQRARYLRIDWNERGTECYLSGRLGAEQGSALETAVMKRAEQVVLADAPDDPAEARMADALVELATEQRSGQGPVPRLVIHADASVLTGDQGETGRVVCETVSGHQLSVEGVRRLACDADIHWVVEHRGRMIGVGNRGRRVRGAVKSALHGRDPTCQFPGCHRRKWLHDHHIHHWGRGGKTELGNLTRLCQAHHRLVHEGGWSIRGTPGVDLRFHDPRGRPLLNLAERQLQLAG